MNTVDIATDAIDTLRSNIREGAEARGKNASGNTSRGLAVLSRGGLEFGEAMLEADHNWRYWGNGRGPGGRPPLDKLKAWSDVRGMSLSLDELYALQGRIAREGSRDYRLKRTNLVLDEIGPWEENDLPETDERLATELERATLEQFND